jgi:hypothetical protein
MAATQIVRFIRRRVQDVSRARAYRIDSFAGPNPAVPSPQVILARHAT